MKNMARQIEIVAIENIVPNPKNRNTHPDSQIEMLCKIIKAQGFREPLIVSKRSGFLIAGHGRLEAAKKLGMTELPVIRQDFESEAQEYQHMIADNEIARWATLDNENLIKDLGEVDMDDFDVDLLGIKDFEITSIEEVVPQCDENEVPEVKSEPVTKRGDIWLLGDHRVMCGDSTIIDDVEKLMNGKKADMVFTDPPYGVSYTKKTKEVFGSKEYTEIKNDEKSGNDLKHFFNDVFSSMRSFMQSHCSYYVCSPQGGDAEMMMMMMRENDMKCRHQIIWVKDAPVFSMGRLDYDYKHEPILYGWCKKHEFQRKGSQDKSVWEFKRTENKLHPTMKPVEMIENAILNSAKEEHLVMDFFLGSGSTLIACEKTNRKCYGMELDEYYCDVIVQRWERYTGKDAVLESNGKKYKELAEV